MQSHLFGKEVKFLVFKSIQISQFVPFIEHALHLKSQIPQSGVFFSKKPSLQLQFIEKSLYRGKTQETQFSSEFTQPLHLLEQGVQIVSFNCF
jgi:hypothetical protein